MTVNEDAPQVIITEQTIYDLGTWLSEEQKYTSKQLACLQQEEHYLPIVSLANDYWLIGALANKLKNSSVWPSIPVTLQNYLTELELVYRQRSEAIRQETIFSCSQLINANIEVLILKGAANLFNGAANPISNRYMSDIDLLVAESKLQESIGALEKKGYFNQEDDDEILIQANAHHHAPPLIRNNGICFIELHRWATPLSSQHLLQTKEIWQHAIPLTLTPNVNVLQMHPTQQIILAIAHSEISDSAFEDSHINLRQLYNLNNLANHFTLTINWSSVEEHFQRANLTHVLYAILFSTHKIFGLMTPVTKLDDVNAKKHFHRSLDRFTLTQGYEPKFNYLKRVFRGYRKQTIVDLYGTNSRFPLLSGRIKHFIRHVQMLIKPKFLTRFIKRNVNRD